MKTFILLMLGSFFFLQISSADSGCNSSTNEESTLIAVSDTVACGAAIVYNIEGNLISIQGVYQNDGAEAVTITYRLTTSKKGKSGTSNNRQGGEKKVGREEKVILSSTTIDYHKDNQYEISLQIIDADDNVLCEVSQELSE